MRILITGGTGSLGKNFQEYIENNFNYSLKKNEDKDLMSFESIPKVVF